ncbi:MULTISPECIES: 1-deoxy-D-xylulose-5-phosphate reductoisomerase [Rhodanobacter]|uniref:1-deoxy-D-xylulose-5-phosphate reductoisomerase n=1 Tax=Rhodanobacter TaxID=75309 RepID=UPI000407D74D|nr:MULTISPECIES: 1-deoxy-D-xylulose-5-phosphate reductoisomerase [Rhodanobacter]KZC19985.1 1-deoxy-D-xylulose-5-phosphate reductoisomerase [Rhodanobacter denitrificans]UJJ52088.1 1-deoxy-D-xylulose-5-phosphate reductoisomerase [Rhodanobacter denitrificans]UJM94834.1 1-deoxy-D-xylulose-5-phosphate reductoisomerase [Rhodanobacter denitrificans]UJM98364.1 1-deoxy-D-xylulose-5-phosphate reductoisomerase [Rhodanobacter denitrificans]UJN22223.1 1-deoxy-D-xylulose-5-phosphate reductoisomerase [Rhodan
MKNVAVLGATGSIGGNTLDVIARHPQRFRASVLTAHRQVEALVALCVQHRPALAVIADPSLEAELSRRLVAAGVRCEVASGHAALTAAAAGGLCDTVVAAIVGAAGLESTLAAARAGKHLLLANKESIVMAGPLLLEAVATGGGALIPVDSEHNAIFQCLPGGRPELRGSGVRRLILTASGGPFRGRTRAELADITPDQACKHPNWVMGRKISVDSATLMNKGLEVIEAHHLFGAPAEAIDVVVHPQSLVHSMVEYVDGSVLAQLGNPDMRTAIAHALAWPERVESGVASLDLAACVPLQFESPDLNTFRCLALAFQALRAGGDAPAVLNAANEIAVEAFLAGALPFLSIADVVEAVLAELPAQAVVDVETLCERDRTAREAARRILRNAC